MTQFPNFGPPLGFLKGLLRWFAMKRFLVFLYGLLRWASQIRSIRQASRTGFLDRLLRQASKTCFSNRASQTGFSDGVPRRASQMGFSDRLLIWAFQTGFSDGFLTVCQTEILIGFKGLSACCLVCKQGSCQTCCQGAFHLT